MTTDLSSPEHPLLTTIRSAMPPERRLRLVVLERDTEMLALLTDILAGDYEIAAPPDPISITAVDMQEPDVLLVGTVEGLTPVEIVALASRHMGLRRVPIILLSADGDVLADASRLTRYRSVTVVSLPFDVDTIRAVVDSVARHAANPASV